MCHTGSRPPLLELLHVLALFKRHHLAPLVDRHLLLHRLVESSMIQPNIRLNASSARRAECAEALQIASQQRYWKTSLRPSGLVLPVVPADPPTLEIRGPAPPPCQWRLCFATVRSWQTLCSLRVGARLATSSGGESCSQRLSKGLPAGGTPVDLTSKDQKVAAARALLAEVYSRAGSALQSCAQCD